MSKNLIKKVLKMRCEQGIARDMGCQIRTPQFGCIGCTHFIKYGLPDVTKYKKYMSGDGFTEVNWKKPTNTYLKLLQEVEVSINAKKPEKYTVTRSDEEIIGLNKQKIGEKGEAYTIIIILKQ